MRCTHRRPTSSHHQHRLMHSLRQATPIPLSNLDSMVQLSQLTNMVARRSCTRRTARLGPTCTSQHPTTSQESLRPINSGKNAAMQQRLLSCWSHLLTQSLIRSSKVQTMRILTLPCCLFPVCWPFCCFWWFCVDEERNTRTTTQTMRGANGEEYVTQTRMV